MALLTIENKIDFPKINYLTASDIYIISCFVFIISSTVEFALVYYRTRLLYDQDVFILYRMKMLRKKLLRKVHLTKKKIEDFKTSSPFSPRKLNVFNVKYVEELDSEMSDNETAQESRCLNVEQKISENAKKSFSIRSHSSTQINKQI